MVDKGNVESKGGAERRQEARQDLGHQGAEPLPRQATRRRREIAEVFEAERTRFGEAPDRDVELELGGGAGEDPLAGGDPDASREDAAFAGEETPSGPQPLPDQDASDAAGEAFGARYEEEEDLRFEKVQERDLDRRRERLPDQGERPAR